MPAAYLSIAGVSKSFGSFVALDNISLTVDGGELVSLLGPSGCGKTTTLRIVAGFIEPSVGSVTLAGKNLNGVAAHHRNIGVVFQSYALFPHLTAAQNVGFGLKMRGVGRSERDKRSADALSLVGLEEFGDRFPSELSGGQQQRVALARALVIEPDILLLDEPLSNLDAGLRAEMRDEIARLRSRLGITTLFVTHDQSEALAMSDRVVVMNHGSIVEVAQPEQLTEQPSRAFTARFLGARTVLAGQVNVRDGVSVFVTESGQEIRLRPQDLKDSPTHIVLRAARLFVSEPGSAVGDSPIDFPAKVEEVVFLGDQRQLTLSVGDSRVTVLSANDLSAPRLGSDVRLRGQKTAVSFLNDSRP